MHACTVVGLYVTVYRSEHLPGNELPCKFHFRHCSQEQFRIIFCQIPWESFIVFCQVELWHLLPKKAVLCAVYGAL